MLLMFTQTDMLLTFTQTDKIVFLAFTFLLFISAQLLVLYLISLYVTKTSISRLPNQPNPDVPADHIAKDVQRYIRDDFPGAVWFGRHAEQFEHQFIKSFDGLKLHAWYLESSTDGKNSTRTAIICHGYSDHIGVIALYTRYFHERGFNVLMLDQRSHGYSEGQYIGMSSVECKDLELWTREVYRLSPDVEDIVWVGWSMGASTVLKLSNKKMDKIRLIIADSGFTSLEEVTLDSYQGKVRRTLVKLIIPPVSSFIKWRTGIDLRLANPHSHVKDALYPILYFHGDQDLRVPLHMGEELFSLTRTPKKLVIAPGSAHVRGFAEHRELFENEMDLFIKDHLA